MSEKAEVMEKQQFNTKLSYYVNEYTGLMSRDFEENGIEFDPYSKQCAVNAMSSIYNLLHTKGLEPKDVNGSNLRGIIGVVTSLKLNSNAMPRECYFTITKKKIGNDWEQQVELGVEGDGNDALLRNWGINVEKVYKCWEVKEGDDFSYPKHTGIEVKPPEWESKGISEKVLRVVYPVKLKDGEMEYLIAERDSVKVNLISHIKNNMMNETFGICESRYKATDAQLKKIKEKKEEILSKVRECATLEEILATEEAKPFMSGAWLDTPESMIVRKMRNNAIKKYPKDFNQLSNKAFLELDETYKSSQEEIKQNENSEEFEIPQEEEQGIETVENPVMADEEEIDLPEFMK